jgi:hypothetical protein
MNKIITPATTSVIPVAMLCIGDRDCNGSSCSIEALYSYSSDNETVIEEAMDSPLMVSTLPTLSSVLLGLTGLGVRGLLKKQTAWYSQIFLL